LRLIVNRGLERRRLTLETRRCELERELLRRRFITFVSHQLQTPLVAVHQYLDVLKHLGGSPDAERKGQEWVDRCLKRTEEMQNLIRDWLTLAKLEGKCFSGKPERVDLKSAVSVVFQVYEQEAAAEEISLEARVTDEACAIKGDLTCLSVLLDNLVGNAIKYNRRGGRVTVTADLRDGEVEIAVRDSGIGIPEKYRPLLFDEFFRVEGEGARKTSGTGLGLPICRQIVMELGGSIRVESEVGVGSTFWVRLPAWREPGVPREAEFQNGGGQASEKDPDCR
jgi:signal transduction histidine kinase